MATKIWYCQQVNTGGTPSTALWWDEDASTAGAATTSNTGWTVAKLAATRYGALLNGSAQTAFQTSPILPDTPAPAVSNTFVDTAVYTPPDLLLDLDCISTLYEYNAVFPAGTWTFAFPVIAVGTGGAQDGRIDIRVFKAARSGTAWTGVTELTTAVLAGTVVTNLATSAAQTSTVTWSAPAFRLNNEFLIVKPAWIITGAGTANNSGVRIQYGSTTRITSPGFRKRSYSIS